MQGLPPLGGAPPRVLVSLETLPEVSAWVPSHSEHGLQAAVTQAFGFRNAGDFELLRLDGRQGNEFLVRVLSRPFLAEVANLESLFAELPDTCAEVKYVQLATITGVPLLRLHRVLPQACGAAVAAWFHAHSEELVQVSGLRAHELREAAVVRFWHRLQQKLEAVFPRLLAQLPEELRQPPPMAASPEQRLARCSRLFSGVVDEVRLRVLPLRMRRVIANCGCSQDPARLWPGSKRLLRVFLDEGAGERRAAGDEEQPGVLVVALGAAQDGQCSFTGHELYYQVSRFFGLPHVQVRTGDGTLVSLERPHEPLLGQLPCSTDGVCVDLVAARHQPAQGSFDQLYREVLRILGPRHFKLDQSYRLQIPCSEEMLTTTQGHAIITTVILIPVSYASGKQMYLFRSPRYRQCKAAMRTFEEFKEMLHAIVQVYGLLTNQISPRMAERLRRACAEGAPGQTPLAPFEKAGPPLSQTWRMMNGCTQASAMGLLGSLQTAPCELEAGAGMPGLSWVPEDMLLDLQAREYQDFISLLNLLGGPFTGDPGNPEARRRFDIYGIDRLQVSADRPPGGANRWADPWSIAVGGLVGMVFGLFEGVCGKTNEQNVANSRHAIILKNMARRGTIGVTASACFHIFGRFLRICVPDGKYATLSRKSIPTSQAVVFLGTFAWAISSHYQYVEPSVVRRLWCQDLNLAERQAAGIILTSGLACSLSVGGYMVGMHFLGGLGAVGAFAGSLMPIFITLVITGLDWWQDRSRRQQMKAAALQTLGLPEPAELGLDVFKPMLSARYKLLACYLHPDKNDSCRCDTTKVFSQIRLAKEILDQELKDYQSCPRERLRRLFEQMVALCGYRRDCFVSEHPSGVIINILEDSAPEDAASAAGEREEDPRAQEADLESLTTVESHSVSGSPPMSPRQATAARQPEGEQLPEVPEDARLTSPAASGDPWVIVPGDQAEGGT